MAVVTIKRPDVSTNISTFVSTDYESGTTLYVENPSGFASGNYIIVGEPGLDTTEITSINADPGSNYLTITALSFDHPRGTPVYYIRWDKYSLQYKTSSTAEWAIYGSMPASLRWDSHSTEYRDATATSSYLWRYRYYSTENTSYSDYSDTILATGWAANNVGTMVKNVRKMVQDTEAKTATDAEIIRAFNKAQDKIYTRYDRWWFLFKIGTAIDTISGTKSYSLPSDFGRMHSVIFRYISGDTDVTYQLKYISIAEMDYFAKDNNDSNNDEIKYYTIYPGDSSNESGYLKIYPAPDTDGLDIIPRYYQTMNVLDSYGDETLVPIPAMLEDYALSEVWKFRGEEDKGSYYDKLFREQADLLKLMQRKQSGPPRQLWKWKGRKALDRYYGTSYSNVSSDDSVESNW